MRADNTANRCGLTFDSMDDFVSSVMACPSGVEARNNQMASSADWHGGVSSMANLAKIARDGISADGIEAARISNDAVTTMERELDFPAFSSFYDVSGANVDVARYLSGEPECMINYHMVDTPRVGRVITLVVSIAAYSVVDPDAIRERGREIMSLVFAIEKIGFQVELWADLLNRGMAGKQGRLRIKVKGPGEELDSARIMFAFTHPGMLRGLGLAAMHLYPKGFHKPLMIGTGYGSPQHSPDMDEYPEGSIMIPPIDSNHRPGRLVQSTLRELGII